MRLTTVHQRIWPHVGDVVRLPIWLPQEPYRVTGVELVTPGVVRLLGYPVRPGRATQPAEYVLPLVLLHPAPDPTWPAPTDPRSAGG